MTRVICPATKCVDNKDGYCSKGTIWLEQETSAGDQTAYCTEYEEE